MGTEEKKRIGVVPQIRGRLLERYLANSFSGIGVETTESFSKVKTKSTVGFGHK